MVFERTMHYSIANAAAKTGEDFDDPSSMVRYTTRLDCPLDTAGVALASSPTLSAGYHVVIPVITVLKAADKAVSVVHHPFPLAPYKPCPSLCFHGEVPNERSVY